MIKKFFVKKITVFFENMKIQIDKCKTKKYNENDNDYDENKQKNR